MEIEILEFIPDEKGNRIGFVDFRVIHSPEKSETFRQVAYFEKASGRWLNDSRVERNGKWLSRYERTPTLAPLFKDALMALDKYLDGKRGL